jgi:hypothetical protein
LGAHLHHSAAALCGIHHAASFFDRDGGGFLDVNVLACLAAVDRHDGVPVVGGRDEDSVHVFLVEQPAKILVARHVAPHGLHPAIEVLVVDVADGAAVVFEVVEVPRAHSPDSDVPCDDFFVRGRGTEEAAVEDGGGGESPCSPRGGA